MDESLATEPFRLVCEPHAKRVKGFPLDSLSIDIGSGQYYYDMEESLADRPAIELGFEAFFKRALKAAIGERSLSYFVNK